VQSQPIALLIGGDILNKNNVQIDYGHKLIKAKPKACPKSPKEEGQFRIKIQNSKGKYSSQIQNLNKFRCLCDCFCLSEPCIC